MPTSTQKPAVAALFKAVPGGYVYRAPNPWLFGRSEHYLVTEAQRDEIIALSPPPPVVPLVARMLVLIALGLAAAMTLNWYRHGYRLGSFTAADTVVVLIATFAAILIAIRWQLKTQRDRMQPLLETLTKTHLRFSREDLSRAVLEANSARQLWLQAGALGLIAVTGLLQILFRYLSGQSVLTGDAGSILTLVSTVLFTVLAAIVFRQARLKAKMDTESKVR